MRSQLLFLIVTCAAINYCGAQGSEGYNAEVKKLTSDLQRQWWFSKDNPVYVKQSYPYGLELLQFTIQSNIFKSFLEYRKDSFPAEVCRQVNPKDNKTIWDFDCVSFTRQERLAMRNYIKRPTSLVWNQYFISGKLVSITEIDSAFRRDLNGNYPLDGWEHIPNGYVEISAPLFLRNNSMCLIYWGHACGMTCGYGTLSIYIKQQGTWKEFASLYSWDS